MVEKFCRSILQIVGLNTKALANLIMGLASQRFATSVVEISLSKVYHYQYSSINKAIKTLDIAQIKSKGQEETSKEEGSKEQKKMKRAEVEKKFVFKGRILRETL